MQHPLQMTGGCSGAEPFALRVLGDSMAPEFLEGELIVIEAGVEIEAGCYVVAEHDSEYIFRQLVNADDQWLLAPLNRKYPTISIDGLSKIRGRVVSKSNGRGRQNKEYL